MTIYVNKEQVTREFYDSLSPFEQGYTTYWQAYWPGAVIPKSCPYEAGTVQAKQFADGANAAMISAMDVEE